MKIIEADPGESMFNVSKRACLYTCSTGNECEVSHNDTQVRVYPGSLSSDIYEKLYYKRLAANEKGR